MVIRRRMGWTAQKAPRLLAVLSSLALVLSACSGGDGLGSGDAATVAEGSAVEVSTDGESWEPREAGDAVPEDARVRASSGGATLAFRSATVRLTPSATGTIRGDELELERGEVLVDGSDLAVRLGDTTISGTGRVRVASGMASRVAVYAGEATVDRPAQHAQVPALRELDLSSFRLAAQPSPLRYSDSDEWDQQLLADALSFDGEAARLARGIDRELGTAPVSRQFYRRYADAPVVSVLAGAAPVARGAAFGPPSDMLLTVFVSEAAADGGAVAPVARQVVDLRGEGARWGLIAVELDVPSSEVVAAIDGLREERLALAGAGEQRTAQQPTDDADQQPGAGAGAGAASSAASETASGGSTSGGSTSGGSGGSTGSGGGGGDSGGEQPPTGGGGGDGGGDSGGGGEDPGGGGGRNSGLGDVVDGVVKTLDDGVTSPEGSRLPVLP